MSQFHFTERLTPGRETALFLTAFVVLSAALCSQVYDQGWVPHVEGRYLHQAERLNAGQLPHGDYESPGTGGLDFIHGLALRTLGNSILVPRKLVIGAGLLAGCFALMVLQRVMSSVAAFALVFATFFWAPGSYLASTPQWYGVFLAFVSIFCLLRYAETGNWQWLFYSSVVNGLVCFVHLGAGVLQFLASVFFLFYLDTEAGPEKRAKQAEGKDSAQAAPGLHWGFKSVVITVALMGAIYILRRPAGPQMLIYFGIGLASLLTVLLVIEAMYPGDFSRLAGTVKAILLLLGPGILLVIPLMFPYLARERGLSDLWQGAVIHALKHLQVPTTELPALQLAASLIPVNAVVLLLIFLHREKTSLRLKGIVVFCSAAGLLYALYAVQSYFQWTWACLRFLLPECLLLGCILLLLGRIGKIQIEPAYRKLLALALSFATCFSLLQLPDCSWISSLYTFPFLMLLLGVLTAPLLQWMEKAVMPEFILYRCLAGSWVLFLFLFAWVILRQTDKTLYGQEYRALSYAPARMENTKVPIRLPVKDLETYRALVGNIQDTTAEGSYIIAFPNFGELYYMSGRRNPFRSYGIPRRKGSLLRAITGGVEDYLVRSIAYNRTADRLGLFARDVELFQYMSAYFQKEYSTAPFDDKRYELYFLKR